MRIRTCDFDKHDEAANQPEKLVTNKLPIFCKFELLSDKHMGVILKSNKWM